MRCQIIIIQQAALFGHVGINALCDITFVKFVAPFQRNCLKGIGESRILEHLALAGHIAVWHVRFCKTGKMADASLIRLKVMCDDFRNRKTVASIGDRRRQNLLHVQAPITAM